MELFSFYDTAFLMLFNGKHSLSFVDALIAGGIALCLWLPVFILQGIGLYKMAKKRGLKQKWFAFLPFLNIYYLGKLTGDCLVFGHKIKRAGLCVMISQIASAVVMSAYLVLKTILHVTYGEYIEITTQGYYATYEWVGLPSQGEWLRRILLLLDGSGGMIGILQIVEVVYKLFLLILLINFFHKYAPRQAIIFSLISCLAPEARYIFIFVLRNRQAINYEEYLRKEREEFARRQSQNGRPYGPYGPYGPYTGGPSSYGQGEKKETSAPPEDPFAEFGSSQKSDENSGGGSGDFFS